MAHACEKNISECNCSYHSCFKRQLCDYITVDDTEEIDEDGHYSEDFDHGNSDYEREDGEDDGDFYPDNQVDVHPFLKLNKKKLSGSYAEWKKNRTTITDEEDEEDEEEGDTQEVGADDTVHILGQMVVDTSDDSVCPHKDPETF